MRLIFKRLILCLLCCALLLTLACCGSALRAEDASPTPSSPASSSALSEPPVFGSPSSPTAGSDEISSLSYTIGEEIFVVPAALYRSPLGYSILYDTADYVCNTFAGGESFWASEGNYLSFSIISDMPLEDVIAGLRLQESISMEANAVSLGEKEHLAYTLHFTTGAGLYRQFWVLNCGGGVLLIEQSYDTVSDDSSLYRATQLAMLDTLTLLN